VKTWFLRVGFFKCNLRRYPTLLEVNGKLLVFYTKVGLYTLNPVYPQLERRLVSTLEPVK
jgi:hypothetical protein